MNPLDGHTFESRSDTASAVRDLFDPLVDRFSPGNARVHLGETGAHFPEVDAHLEGYARPLWGIAPHVAGGGTFDHWDGYRAGLANGTDPDHPEYWGDTPTASQKHVEMAAIGVALALAPEHYWEPLDAGTQRRVATWLGQIDDVSLHAGNWKFFRVLTTLGLREVGAPHDWDLTQETLDELETYYLEEGWYADGPEDSARGYYIPWAMHTYGLLYAAIAGDEDPERAERFRDRAGEFAADHRHWFDEQGRGLPFGRSLTYRFAQAAFWGALALADVEALPWGEIRGLWARNLRWWADQPIFTDGGVLSIGYRYPSLKMSEDYNSPCSPYWAMKAFLPLAVDDDHPFWTAEERPIADRPSLVHQPEPGMVICDDESSDHHFALLTGQNSDQDEKYTKFATSTTFGFSVRGRHGNLYNSGHDSLLAVCRAGDDHYRIRTSVDEARLTDDGLVYSAWSLWAGFDAETWLAPALPWYVRVHRVRTTDPVTTAEGGFALDRRGDDDSAKYERRSEDGRALARYSVGESGIVDLGGDRSSDVVSQEPNTNLLASRTVVPTLRGDLDAGTHWLVCAVTGAPASGDAGWQRPPTFERTANGFVIRDAAGEVVCRRRGDAVERQ